MDNQQKRDIPIQVIQGGVGDDENNIHAPIPLERTNKTRLSHKVGAISMARGTPDYATTEFFICLIKDQPELDFGGKRNPDLQGFAVFGKVVKGGGEAVGYQFRRKGTTCNMLFLCDNNGIPLSCSDVIPGNHHHVYDVENQLEKMLEDIKKSKIRTDYLFLNADAGFDTENVRDYCKRKDLFANIDFNRRNGNISEREESYIRNYIKEGL